MYVDNLRWYRAAGDNVCGSVTNPVLCGSMSGYDIPVSDDSGRWPGPDPEPRGSEGPRGRAPGFEGRRRIQKAASVWDVLADTSSQMSAELRREAEAERGELRLGEAAGISLTQRLHASRDRLISLQLSNGDGVDLRVLNVSKHWVRGESTRGETLIPMTAIATVQGLPVRAGEWSHRLVSESSFQMALRAMIPKETLVLAHAGGTVRGRIVAVGADWVEILGFTNNAGPIENTANGFLTIPTTRVVRVDVLVPPR